MCPLKIKYMIECKELHVSSVQCKSSVSRIGFANLARLKSKDHH